MKKIVYERDVESEDDYFFRYTVIEEKPSKELELYEGEVCYSFEIMSFDRSGVIRSDETVYFEDVSRSISKAKKLLDILSDNCVTPETAELILEELISFGGE